MRNLLFVLVLILFIGIQNSYGQKKSNIIDMSNRFQLHFYGKQKFSEISFIDEKNNKSLIYSPNDQVNIGFGFNYRIFGLGLAFNFKFINNDDLVYGDTKRLDWQMNGYGKKSVIDLTFFYYKSFYLENPQNALPNWNEGDANYIRPDIIMSSFGMSYIYVFNNKEFSYKAAFISNAIQKKSAGSFLFGGQFNITGLNSDSSLFPISSTFNNFSPINHLYRNSMGFSFGYAHNLILPHYFYISASFSVTPSLGLFNFKSNGQRAIIEVRPGLGIVPRVAMGYNGMNYYGGISMSTQISGIKSSSTEVPDYSWQNGNIRFFVGKRF